MMRHHQDMNDMVAHHYTWHLKGLFDVVTFTRQVIHRKDSTCNNATTIEAGREADNAHNDVNNPQGLNMMQQ